MPRQSRTPFVILGLLCTEPMSGYELRGTIERTVGHFWRESFGQIYPTLQRLRDEGLIDVERDDSSTGRKRTRYRPTDAGRQRLASWLSEPAQPQPQRNELLLKVFFGRFGPQTALRAHIGRSRDEARALAESLDDMRRHLQTQETDADELRYWLLTVDLGRRIAEARRSWAEHALDVLARSGEEA
jgi:DNA-binding PadR family transcriptional regulator